MATAQTGTDVVVADELMVMYLQMAVIRGTEKAAHDLFLSGLVKGTTHLAAGQEAVAVGASSAIVGAHLPMAVGAAWSARLRNSGQVAVAFFGDGATNIGAFHEALNLAAVWRLPVIFICENNLHMEYTPISAVTPVARPAADRAVAYGLPGETVDGNDVVLVRAAVARAGGRARAGDGPTVLEAETYRHFGHSRTDPARYRPEDEVRRWLAHDPLSVTRAQLEALGVPSEQVDELDQQAARAVADAVASAKAAPGPDPGTALTDVWADGSAALTGMRPVAEIMFSNFLACCWDYIANEMPKIRYMTGGQVTVPLVVRTANGGGLGFGAQHSQAVENWALTVPGLKIAAPSTPADVIGMMAAAIRSDDPVIFFEHKGLFASKGEPAPDGHVVPLGQAAVVRAGTDITMVALASTVPTALAAADQLAAAGVSAEVIDLRSLVPLDMRTVLDSLRRTSRLMTVEENPYQGGWGGTVVSIVVEEGFELLDAPVRRVASACVPLPFADALEDEVIPTVAKAVTAARRILEF